MDSKGGMDTTGELKAGVALLPHGDSKPAIVDAHFPTREQAFIWRNWGLLSLGRLAGVLGTGESEVRAAGEAMGLVGGESVDEQLWLRRGYVTLIRRNWHLLPYEQLLELLGWSVERLLDVLKEEDFLWNKLGKIKPRCEPLRWRELSAAERQQTEWLRRTVAKHFGVEPVVLDEKPFAFLNRFDHRPGVGQQPDKFDLCLGYSFTAIYGDPLLDPGDDFFRDAELAAMSSWGINGVWFQAILFKLFPWGLVPELSAGYEKRLATLQDLVDRAARHGIKVFLYLNEPRFLPDWIFERIPHLRGAQHPDHGCSCLCTAMPETQAYVEQATEFVFSQVNGLGGCFTITQSENPTHCRSKRFGIDCPRCKDRPIPELIGAVNSWIEKGVHAASPEARVLVWNWAWDPVWGLDVVDHLPDGVEVVCTSESYIPITVGGIESYVSDYSMSHPGPGENALSIWQQAKARGLRVVAKVQVNNSWECSTVPYIPAVGLVDQHLNGVKKAGVDNLLFSWTLGGYLGGNLGLFQSSIDEWAATLAGEEHAVELQRAWAAFSSAFTEFPFHVGVLYVGPQNSGPGNLLYAEPTGYAATMVCFPYDNIERWRSRFTDEVLDEQFHALADGWQTGLKILEELVQSVGSAAPETLIDQLQVAQAVYAHFRSSALQIRFVRLRNAGQLNSSPEVADILQQEIDLAKRHLDLIGKDSRIGFEPTNQYVYRQNDLMEKVVNCEWILTRRAEDTEHGLTRTNTD